MENVEKWLFEWFRRHGGEIVENLQQAKEQNYFNAGWIDSMGVIELISEIEQYFNIAFSAGDFQDRRFSTIAGLAEIIQNRMSGGK